MARVLCVWEMGSGLGHLAFLKPFVDAARSAGHEVSLAAKELQNVGAVFPDPTLPVFQAPYLWRPPRHAEPGISSYPELVLRRFETPAELAALCRAWDAIFDAVRPDLVVYDFAPSALIASLGRGWRKWVTGSGFLVPRTDGPFFGVFPGVRNEPKNVARLARVRAAPAGADQRGASVERASTRRAGARTDHAGRRDAAADAGRTRSLRRAAGRAVPRPAVPLRRGGAGMARRQPPSRLRLSFRRSRPWSRCSQSLLRQEASVLVYSRDIGADVRARFPQVRFSDRPLDMEAVCAQADLLVNMGNHGTAAQAYLAGVPQLLIPPRQEQMFLARRVAAQGRGVNLSRNEPAVAERVADAMALAAAGRRPVEAERRAALSGPLLAARLKTLFDNLPAGK